MTEWKVIATALIKQLPKEHEGRNTWLMNNSSCEESKGLKVKNILLETYSAPDEKLKKIMDVFTSNKDVMGGEWK